MLDAVDYIIIGFDVIILVFLVLLVVAIKGDD